MSSTHVCLPIYGGLWTVAGDGYDEVDAAEDEGLSTTANNATAIGCDPNDEADEEDETDADGQDDDACDGDAEDYKADCG